MKSRLKKKFFLVLMLTLLLVLFLAPKSYSYFDKLHSQLSLGTSIGEWIFGDGPSNAEELKQYIIDNHEDHSDYLIDSIGHYDSDGKYQLNETFDNYSPEELVETIELLEDFAKDFLEENPDGSYKYPDQANVNMVDLEGYDNLMPGQNVQIRQMINTAERANQPEWIPITLQVIIESPSGHDISDYSIEILICSLPFREIEPLKLNYSLWDNHRWNSQDFTRGFYDPYKLLEIQGPINLTRTVYKQNTSGTYVPGYYYHTYSKPTVAGNWTRIPEGPNYYIGTPRQGNYGNIQAIEQQNPRFVDGFTINGMPSGNPVDARLQFASRRPRTYDTAPVLPIVIVVSRGLKVDSAGDHLTQRTDVTDLKITLRTIGADIWLNDPV